MNTRTRIRLEIPTDMRDELISKIRDENNISIEPISDRGGLRSPMLIFEVIVGVASLIQTGLKIYEFLRDLKKKTGKIEQVTLEAKPDNADKETIRVEINPIIPKPVIRDNLSNMQSALSPSII